MLENPQILSAEGQTYKDFVITKYLPLKELKCSLVELVHVPTDAKIMHIANDDPENLFCLSFQTLPYSSNGIAHILEHTVLCGSEKFPIKDPFFSMTRRSLNTFMNAMTGQDFTCYPASSQVEKDFYNLLEVYLDACFHPELKKMSFLQEGHRLQFLDPKDSKSPLTFQGVVFNEMKGAMSSIDSRLWEALSKRLIPDLPYAFNSGGNPKEIPDLTYQELIDFHKEFYHPSRSIFFFYGNLPLVKHLNFIEKELSRWGKVASLPPLSRQKRFEEPYRGVDFYPVTDKDDTECQIAFSWLTAHISDQMDILALTLLESILTDTDASPLTMAFLKSGLCTQLDSALDVEMSEIPWILTCKGCKEEDAEELEKLLFQTLENVEFSENEIDAALHQLEFERLEIGAEGYPYGLTLFMRAALLKQHGCEPENGLLIHSLFSALKEHLKDPKYLKTILKKYVTENPHFVRLTLKPDSTLNQKEMDEEKKQLSEIQEKLNDKQKQEIVLQADLLAQYQANLEHQSIDCLPKVTLLDVPKKGRDFELEKTKNIFFHECFTNKILYADLVFDLPAITEEEIPLLSLFAKLLPEIGSSKRNYEEMLHFQQSYIGSFDPVISLNVQHENSGLCRPTFTLRGKVLHKNRDKLFELFSEICAGLDFQDQKRIQEWMSQHATELKENLNRLAMKYATLASLKGLSIPAMLNEKMHGFSYANRVQKWAKKVDPTFLAKLQNLSVKVLGHKNYSLVIGSDREQFEDLKAQDFFRLQFNRNGFTPWDQQYPLEKGTDFAHLISARVAFSAFAKKTISYNDEDAPYLLLSTELMANTFLHTEIREKGGAYGSGASYSASNGTFHFYAYRDPNLKRSVDIFKQAAERIAEKKFNERELEEAKLGVLQTLDAPVSPGNRAFVAYSWMRSQRSYSLRDHFRMKILSASSDEIANSVRGHLCPFDGNLVSFLGKELYEKESLDLPLYRE